MKTARWLIAASMALALAGCGLFDSPAKQRASAEAALVRGDYGEAAVTVRSLLDDDAENAELRLLLARVLIMQGDFEAAHRTLQAAVERGAAPEDVALVRMRWLLEQGDFQLALELASDPGTPFSDERRAYYRARALQGLRRVPEAIAVYRQLSAEKPESAELHLRLAQCHAFLGRDEAAREAVKQALRIPAKGGDAPVKAEAWMLEGALAARANDRVRVREAYREAAAAAPGELTALQQGQLLTGAIDLALWAGDLDAARHFRGQLARVLPQSPLSRMMGAQIRLFDADPAEAVAELQRLTQDTADPRVRLLLAGGHLVAGSFEQALTEANALAAAGFEGMDQVQQLIKSASSSAAQSPERSMAASAALVAMGQPALARLMLERARSRQPDNLDLLRALAQAELRSGRVDEALRLARDLATQRPEVPVVKALLAEVQVANGDHAGASETYEEVWKASANAPLALAFAQARRRAGLDDAEWPLRQWLQRQPRDNAVRLSLAAALQQNGATSEAIRELQRALTELPAGHPMRAIALNNLAVMYGQSGDGRALETARAAYEIAGAVPSIQDTYGWLLVRNGRPKDGLPLLQAAVDASPQEAEIRFHYAVASLAAGDKDMATAYLADLIESEQDFEGRAEAERLYTSL
jgi:predicted Zn-dependent protease